MFQRVKRPSDGRAIVFRDEYASVLFFNPLQQNGKTVGAGLGIDTPVRFERMFKRLQAIDETDHHGFVFGHAAGANVYRAHNGTRTAFVHIVLTSGD